MTEPARGAAAVVVETATLTVAHAAQVCVVVPRGPPTTEGVRHIHGALEQLARRVKTGIGMLFVVGERVAPPSGDTRTAVAEMFRAMHPHLKVVSAQMAGSGFIAAAKRSVFTWATSRLLGTTPVRVFGDLADAADWLHARSGELGLACPPSLDLQAFVQATRVTPR
jgi:hypothetical protein